MVANDLEVLKLGSVSLDGTKVKANASKHTASGNRQFRHRGRFYWNGFSLSRWSGERTLVGEGGNSVC